MNNTFNPKERTVFAALGHNDISGIVSTMHDESPLKNYDSYDNLLEKSNNSIKAAMNANVAGDISSIGHIHDSAAALGAVVNLLNTETNRNSTKHRSHMLRAHAILSKIKENAALHEQQVLEGNN